MTAIHHGLKYFVQQGIVLTGMGSASLARTSKGEKMKLQIMKHVPDLILPEIVDGSDWIDLRAAEDIWIPQGSFALVSLGVSIKLPEGYEAYVIPRSSTFKNYGIIQTNHVGLIDHNYCGSNDIWKWPAFCLKGNISFFSDGVEVFGSWIHKNDRICQFRINKIQPEFEIEEVDTLDGESRGGFGSTGVS